MTDSHCCQRYDYGWCANVHRHIHQSKLPHSLSSALSDSMNTWVQHLTPSVSLELLVLAVCVWASPLLLGLSTPHPQPSVGTITFWDPRWPLPLSHTWSWGPSSIQGVWLCHILPPTPLCLLLPKVLLLALVLAPFLLLSSPALASPHMMMGPRAPRNGGCLRTEGCTSESLFSGLVLSVLRTLVSHQSQC